MGAWCSRETQGSNSQFVATGDVNASIPNDFIIDNGDVRRLWSYNSSSGPGRYMFISNPTKPGSESCIVAANGDAEDKTLPLCDITFNEVQRRPDPQLFQLQFSKNNRNYLVNASETGVVAAQVIVDNGSNDATTFQVMQLLHPNSEYCVLQSNQKQGTDLLYLSSDGAGKMKLKVWNKPIPGPRETTAEVDPALLFRLVRPFGQK